MCAQVYIIHHLLFINLGERSLASVTAALGCRPRFSEVSEVSEVSEAAGRRSRSSPSSLMVPEKSAEKSRRFPGGGSLLPVSVCVCPVLFRDTEFNTHHRGDGSHLAPPPPRSFEMYVIGPKRVFSAWFSGIRRRAGGETDLCTFFSEPGLFFGTNVEDGSANGPVSTAV